jgi:hypothetical protein
VELSRNCKMTHIVETVAVRLASGAQSNFIPPDPLSFQRRDRDKTTCDYLGGCVSQGLNSLAGLAQDSALHGPSGSLTQGRP